ncbi:MAG TPA: hypothetical protein VMT46_06595 [Anaerolineaceae bacterium]|nr:hypothetical protein [Anaerolineaceae bacterium]
MKLIAIEKELPGKTAADFEPHQVLEAKKAWELYQAGIFRELYFHKADHTAIIVLECSGVVEAREVLDSLPLVQQGLITFDILPLVPYPGFSRLFSR